MRSNELTPIFKNLNSISGIGPKLSKILNNHIGNKLVNSLWHLPYNIIKIKICKKISNIEIGSNILIKVNIIKHNPSRFKNQPYKIICKSNDTPIDLIYFYGNHPYIKRILPEGEIKFITGKLEFYKNNYQIVHPTNIMNDDNIKNFKHIQPIYGLTAGLTHKTYNKIIDESIKNLPDINEWIDDKILKKYFFQDWKKSLSSIHNPKNLEDISKNNLHRRRLAYDELLAHQLAISIIRNFNQKHKGIMFNKKSNLVSKIINDLPFKLTESQKNAWKEIYLDLISKNQMVRLLQGDVGSGKTIVSILAMAQVIDSGFQVAMMAPTTILAKQHYENINLIFSKYKIQTIFLTSNDKGKERNNKLQLIKNINTKIVIGTHSLIQDEVEYSKIGLVIIDEQHKFGVFERIAFTKKGEKPSLLVMSATPIPRSLCLAMYGDIDQSRITEKPYGRVDTITKSLPLKKSNELINRLIKKLNKNEKAYWVCPLIEESEELDIQNANERFNILNKIFKNKTLLLHGKLKENEKEDIMKKFKEEDYRILVSTTVIEVGIDIKEATLLIVENAERFGLAQLHQLRGRIGRNNLQSTCILLYKEEISLNAKKRIKKMKETNDGFEIAEKDLEIRGPGEILGKKQSGLPSFLIADLSFDKDLLEDVRKEVNLISQIDPKLKSKKGNNLINLLYLFEKDIAIKTLQAG